MKQLKEGDGWRVGWRADEHPFPALLGSEQWAIELTAEEFQAFCQMLAQLRQTLVSLADELMAEERISCEQENELLWMEVDGFPRQFDLRFILLTGRGSEGYWPAPVVPELMLAIDSLAAFP